MQKDNYVEMKPNEVCIGWVNKKLPPGVVGEHIQGWSTIDISKKTPPEVQQFMKDHNAEDLYNKFAETMVGDAKGYGKTCGIWSKDYSREKMKKVEDKFLPEFQRHGINVVVCSNSDLTQTDAGVIQKWIEYIDIGMNRDYVPEEKYEISQKDSGCIVF